MFPEICEEIKAKLKERGEVAKEPQENQAIKKESGEKEKESSTNNNSLIFKFKFKRLRESETVTVGDLG
uniref:Uncharacterized protein n=1 Tax=Megaselia scalaris TaxID=36166 RepID=T1GFF3_MEGSC